MSDQAARVCAALAGPHGETLVLLRRIEHWNADKQQILVLFTNLLHLAALLRQQRFIFRDLWHGSTIRWRDCERHGQLGEQLPMPLMTFGSRATTILAITIAISDIADPATTIPLSGLKGSWRRSRAWLSEAARAGTAQA